jgi:hypothetical protein
MLPLNFGVFQHLGKNAEIPKQIRNDYPTIYA